MTCPPTIITTTTASTASCHPIHAAATLSHIESQIRQQKSPSHSDSSPLRPLPMAIDLTKHAPTTLNGCTDMKNDLLSLDMTNGLVQHMPLSHNPSYYLMLTDNDTSNQPPMQQLHHMLPLPMMPQQFEEVFRALQQQIQEQHLILKAKIQSLLAFSEQQHNNLSQTVSSPPE